MLSPGARDGTRLCFANPASSATVALQQYPPQTSEPKTVHRTVFLTLAFDSIHRLLDIKKKKCLMTFLFLGPSDLLKARLIAYHDFSLHIYWRITHQIPSLKTVHRTVFLTLAFDSIHRLLDIKKKKCLMHRTPKDNNLKVRALRRARELREVSASLFFLFVYLPLQMYINETAILD